MAFIKKHCDPSRLVDNVFGIVARMKEDEKRLGKGNSVNCSVGSLKNEDDVLVAYKVVFDNEAKLPSTVKAAYAAGLQGNREYLDASMDWALKGKVNLAKDAIATSGGTGALYLAISCLLDEGDNILIPHIGWGSYKLMANDNHLNIVNYNVFDVDDICAKMKESSKSGKVFIVLNSPCHNPTGYSYTKAEFEKIIDCANELSKTSEVVILNDVAYIDYSVDYKHSRDYMEAFNNISDNVLVLVAFSTSKTFSYYGERLGSLIILNKSKEVVDSLEAVFEKKARCVWSNVNNGAMVNITNVLKDHKDEYFKEREEYVSMLKKRGDLFTSEADECGLEYYPYKEGFFVTLKIDDPAELSRIHEALLNDRIYAVKVNKGIRIAICSTPLHALKGLAKRIKDLY